MPTSKHYTDEWLIAHADGELPESDQAEVHAHLQGCWDCRLRLKELEDAALVFTKACHDYEFADPSRLIDGRLRFEDQARRHERNAARPDTTPARGLWASAAFAACCAGLLVAWFQFLRPETVLPSRDLLVRMEAADRPGAQKLVRQVFEIEVAEVRPVLKQYRRRLIVVADPERKRFESRLLNEQGALRHALWRSGPGEQYRYDSVRNPRPVVFAHRADNVGLPGKLLDGNLPSADIESKLVEWLEQRSWTPVSLARPVSQFAGEDGTILDASRTTGPDGTQRLRVVVRKRRGAVTVEAVLEADSRTYRPVLQSLRCYSPLREFEVRVRPVDALVTQPVTFRPDAALFGPPREAARPAPGAPSTSKVLPVEMLTPRALSDSLDRKEVEALYALHTIRACLGEPVEVVRGQDSHLIVRGVVSDEERKRQVLAALGKLAGEPWLTLQVRTTADIFPEVAGTVSSSLTLKLVRPHSRFLSRIEAHFAGRLAEPKREAREFRDVAMKHGGALLSEAIALREISERLRDTAAMQMDRESERLLTLMARDHARSVRLQALGLRGHLAPVFEILFEDQTLKARGEFDTSDPAAASLDPADTAVLVRRIYDTETQLFGGDESAAEHDERVGQILADLVRVESEVQNLAVRLSASLERLR
jgi:hypothetical protein